MPGVNAIKSDFLCNKGRVVSIRVAAEGCNVLVNQGQVAGQEVTHVHWHIIPRIASDGLGYRWLPKAYGSGEMEAMQQKILSAIA